MFDPEDEDSPLPPPGHPAPPHPPPGFMPPHPPHPLAHPPRREIIPPLVLKCLILTLLAEKPLHGYEIAERLREITGHRVPRSIVYAVLNWMESKELLHSKWVVEGSRAKKLYYLTEFGAEFLDRAKKLLNGLKAALDFIFQKS